MPWRDDDRWPGRPAPLPDESISSWFARLAGANGLRPSDLFAILQPGGYRYPRDLDRHADEALLGRLEEATGVGAEQIKLGTFRRWIGHLFGTDDGLIKLHWLPPAGREDTRRSYGQQVCPGCLAEDSQPYLRLTWRLSFLVACPKHKRLLVDRCPSCGEPVNVLRRNRTEGMECWKCDHDFRSTETDPVGSDILCLQSRVLAMVEDRWTVLGEAGPIHALAYVQLLALIFRLLVSGKHALPLRTWLTARDSAFACDPIPRMREVELLNPRARRDVLRMTDHLLRDWPNRFVEACAAVRLTSRHLLKSGRSYPFAFQQTVEQHLTTQHRAIGGEELEAAKRQLACRGIKPTYRALVELTGVKITAERARAEAADATAAPWGQGRYWKLDGISPEVKAAARLAAHRSGENVAVWLDRLVRKELNMPAMRVS